MADLTLAATGALAIALDWVEGLASDAKRPLVAALVELLNDGKFGRRTPAEISDALAFAVRTAEARRLYQNALTRARVARHEAAHAVIGAIVGLHVRRVTIEPDELAGSLGHASFSDVRPVRDPAHAEAIAVMQAAGPLGERLPSPELIAVHRAEAWDALCLGYPQLPRAERAAVARGCEERARDLIDANLAWIQAVAADLLARGTISGADVLALEPAAAAAA